MKLSDIVYYCNHLDSINTAAATQRAMTELNAMRHVVEHGGVPIGNYAEKIHKKYNLAVEAVNSMTQVMHDLRDELSRLIKQHTAEYMAESTRLYEQEMRHVPNEYTLGRRLRIDDNSNILLRSRLRTYTDWRVPGMIIHPGNESFIEDLVPLDPLYIVDHHTDLITPCIGGFNSVYQSRLRPYVISESNEHILGDLPDGQFGLVFAYNFFNYKPYEVLQRYLKELFLKMRPGGAVILTFNDCDRGHGVALTEAKFMCYTPKNMIINYAESLGFDLSNDHTGLGDVSWLEFQKPGKISSLRGGQTLAKIVARSK
jgi:hypothetical protein